MLGVFILSLAAIAVLIIVLIAAVVMSGGGAKHTGVTGGAKNAKSVVCELAQFEEGDRAALAEITSDEETMKWIANGKPWPEKKVDSFLKWALRENATGRNRYWAVVTKPRKLVGTVGIHPVSYRAGSVAGRDFVTVFVRERRRGCGTAALREALARRWQHTRRPVYADARPDNAASLALLKKVGFRRVGEVEIRGTKNVRHRADAPAPAVPPELAAAGTFLILGKQLSSDILASTFAAAGWAPTTEEAARAAGRAGILALEGARSWDKSLREIACLIKSRLDAEVLTNKVVLHDRLEGTGATPETVVVPAGKGFVPALPAESEGCGVWIWRPEGGWAGRGVEIVEGKAALYRTAKRFAKHNRAKRALVTRLIESPKLLGGKKFHLRLYLVAAVVPEGVPRAKAGKRVLLCPEGDIAIAKEAYRPSQYHVKAIHDTHVSGHENPEGLRFPADYPGDGAVMLGLIAGMLTTALTPLLPEVVTYTESYGGYEIYGVDVMVDSADRPWLIEINSRPGYALTPDGISEKRQRWVTSMVADAIGGAVFGAETKALPVCV